MSSRVQVRHLIIAPLLATWCLGAIAAQGDQQPGILPASRKLSEQDAVDMALQSNPGLAEIQARAQAMAAIPRQAGALPDPMLGFAAMSLPANSFSLAQEPMTQMQFSLSQSLPFPGKRALREQAATQDAAAAARDVDEAKLLLVRDVKQAWWTLFSLDRSLSIVSRNQELLRQFIQIAQTKYRVGTGLQQDVLLAQLELSKLLDMQFRLQGARDAERSRFNALLNLPSATVVQVSADVNAALRPLANQQTLFESADDLRPVLARQRSRIDAAQSRVELAQRDLYPDFNLGASYGIREGRDPAGGARPDLASFEVSVNLPIFAGRKQHRAIDQRNSELLEQRFAFQDVRNRVQAEIGAARAEYERARDQFGLYEKGILPQARETVSSMLAGYQVNKVDFLNLINAQVTLYNYEISYWQLLSDARQAAAELAAAVGEEQIYE